MSQKNKISFGEKSIDASLAQFKEPEIYVTEVT